MSVLPNNTAGCFQAIKTAIQTRIESLPGARKVYKRMRYADNLNQWHELAAIVVNDESRLQVIFIYLSDFSTDKKESGFNSITATYQIEVVFQFREGDDNDNSTLDFENELGNINDLFLDETALGFTDNSSNPVLNIPITGDPDENRGSPVYVDGILAHRKILSLQVTFRMRRGV